MKFTPRTRPNIGRGQALGVILTILVVAVSMSCSSESGTLVNMPSFQNSQDGSGINWLLVGLITVLSTVSIIIAISLYKYNWLPSKLGRAPLDIHYQALPETEETSESVPPVSKEIEDSQGNANTDPVIESGLQYLVIESARLRKHRDDLNTVAIRLDQENARLQADVNDFKETNSQLIESTKQLIESNEQLEKSNQEQLEHINGLESQLSQMEEYSKRQAELPRIKKEYKAQQNQLTHLIKGINGLEPTRELLSPLIDNQIDDENEYDAVSGRLSILKDLEVTAAKYQEDFDRAIVRSSNLAAEIEQSNAGKQVEFIRKIIQKRRLNSLSVIPEILQDIQQRIGNTNRPINPRSYSDISDYRQYLLDQHPPNLRAVPVSVTDLLTRLCDDAQVGEMETLEAMVDFVLESLGEVYGKP